MKVSFDLDDTLFVAPDKFKVEKALKFPFNLIYRERLRYGTVELLNKIRKNGIKLWVYTTSFRSESYIRGLFRCYGIKIDYIVNGDRHAREVQANRPEAMPSKYPAKYRIDLHIDDDVSVYQNGISYGFKVHLVGEQDDEWADKIWEKIMSIKQKNNQL